MIGQCHDNTIVIRHGETQWYPSNLDTNESVHVSEVSLLTLGAHALEGYSTWFVIPSFLPSVCLLLSVFHVFCDYAQRDNKTAIPPGSSPHWLHFKKGDFRITAAFESYGVKSKSRSQYAN